MSKLFLYINDSFGKPIMLLFGSYKLDYLPSYLQNLINRKKSCNKLLKIVFVIDNNKILKVLNC